MIIILRVSSGPVCSPIKLLLYLSKLPAPACPGRNFGQKMLQSAPGAPTSARREKSNGGVRVRFDSDWSRDMSVLLFWGALLQMAFGNFWAPLDQLFGPLAGVSLVRLARLVAVRDALGVWGALPGAARPVAGCAHCCCVCLQCSAICVICDGRGRPAQIGQLNRSHIDCVK